MIWSGTGWHGLRQAPPKWQAGPGTETPSRDFRGRGGFAVCRPQGEVRSR
jgi:hypothetical protein